MRVLLILFLPVLALSLDCPSYTKTVNGEWQVTHPRICDAGKFCKLTMEHDVEGLKGHCQSTEHLQHCVHNCHSSCVCCENATCVQDFINSLTATQTVVPLESTIMPPCFDHVKEHHCHTIPDICQQGIAKDVCPRFCGLCTDNTGSSVTTNHPVSVASNCIDDNEFCCSDPDICKNKYGSLLCVNTCSNNTLEACIDTGPFCYNDICNDSDLARGPCKKTCGFCSISSTQPTTSEKTTITTTTPMLKTTMKPTMMLKTTPTPTTPMLKTTPTPTTMLKTTPKSTTTTTTTTIKPTTVPTTTKALPITTTQKATQCYQCGDINTHTYCDGIDLIMPTLKACPHSQPYCVTDIFLSTNDMPQFIRRCSNRDRCIKDWWEGTSDRPLCVDSDPTLATVTATCTYCCVTDGCNQDSVPLKSTFFKP